MRLANLNQSQTKLRKWYTSSNFQFQCWGHTSTSPMNAMPHMLLFQSTEYRIGLHMTLSVPYLTNIYIHGQ